MFPRSFPRMAGCLLVALTFASHAHAQFWTTKPYSEWSQQECEKMLKDSPWARSYTLERVLIETSLRPAKVPGREQTPQISYYVRLLSAAPIRQAMVRNAQLGKKYAALPPEQKQVLLARHKSFLEQTYDDNVVFLIVFETNALAYRSELAAAWQAQAEEVLKQQIFLFTDRGRFSPERIFIDSSASGGEIQLIFPRVVNGQPLLQPGDKGMSLEFPHPTVGVLAADRVRLEFKVKNMMLNNELVF